MNRWDIEKVFSEETKNNLITLWKNKTKEDFEDNEKQNDYLNQNLGNSFLLIIEELEGTD